MSASSILLFVGATTLVAALVTLCAFQMNAAKLERRINRRSRTLEGPVPGHRSLSSIGLNADAARTNPRSSRLQSPKSTSPVGLRDDGSQEPTPSSSPPPVGEARLNSLQTIQARSAALQAENEQAKPANPDQVEQRPPEGDASGQDLEQGLAERHSKSGTEKAGNLDSIAPSSAPAADPRAQPVATKIPASKRAKRASVQADRIESSHPTSDQAPSDALADAAGPEFADPLQSSGIDGPVSQDDGLPDIFAGLDEADAGTFGLVDDLGDDDGLPDIFAGLDEADAGTLGLVDDLSDDDGAGLPRAGLKIPRKSRR